MTKPTWASWLIGGQSCRQHPDAIARATLAEAHAGMYALPLWPPRPGYRDGSGYVIAMGSMGGIQMPRAPGKKRVSKAPTTPDESGPGDRTGPKDEAR